MQPTTESPFTGWHRRGRGYPWRPVVQAATEADAWRQLLDAALRGDRCVLPTGRHPVDRPGAVPVVSSADLLTRRPS
jgi:hypothetical protein